MSKKTIKCDWIFINLWPREAHKIVKRARRKLLFPQRLPGGEALKTTMTSWKKKISKLLLDIQWEPLFSLRLQRISRLPCSSARLSVARTTSTNKFIFDSSARESIRKERERDYVAWALTSEAVFERLGPGRRMKSEDNRAIIHPSPLFHPAPFMSSGFVSLS